MASLPANLPLRLSHWPLRAGIALLCLGLSSAFVFESRRVLLVGPREIPQQMIAVESWLGSLGRVFVGAGSSFFIGLIVIVVLARAPRFVTLTVMSASLLFAITPPPIWSTVSLLWFGLGNTASISTTFCSTVFMLVAVNCWLLLQLPSRRHHIAQVYEVPFARFIRLGVLPELREGLIFGLRLDLLVAWIAVIVAEGAGTSSGLGAMLLLGRQLFDWNIVIASWFAIIGSAVLTDSLVAAGAQIVLSTEMNLRKQC